MLSMSSVNYHQELGSWKGAYEMAVVSHSCRYETRLYEGWCQTVSEKSQYNLSRPLLKRDPETKQITVNFNPQVSEATGISYWVPEEFSLT